MQWLRALQAIKERANHAGKRLWLFDIAPVTGMRKDGRSSSPPTAKTVV